MAQRHTKETREVSNACARPRDDEMMKTMDQRMTMTMEVFRRGSFRRCPDLRAVPEVESAWGSHDGRELWGPRRTPYRL